MTLPMAAAARITVLGHRGLLGRALVEVLRERYGSIATTDERFDPKRPGPFLEAIRRTAPDAIVNSIAALPSAVTSPDTMQAVNGRLPALLAGFLEPGQVLVQPSTDGVFSGARGGYVVDDPPDAEDDYGRSKRLGEEARFAGETIVIRSSIIGPEGGLMAWLLAQPGPVQGFTNHRWNGVTTRVWAATCAELLACRAGWRSRVEHLTCATPVTKFELLRTIAAIFRPDLEVRPVVAPQPLDRTLVPTIAGPPIDEQIAALAASAIKDRSREDR